MKSAQNINMMAASHEMIGNRNGQRHFAQDQKVSARNYKNKLRKGKQTRDLSQKIEQSRDQERPEPMEGEDVHRRHPSLPRRLPRQDVAQA